MHVCEPAAKAFDLPDMREVGFLYRRGKSMESEFDLINWYKDVLREDPTSEIFVSLAEMLYSQKRWEETIRICRWGLGMHPRHIRARVLLGLALLETEQQEEARKELEKARIEIEKNAFLYKALAEIAANESDMDRAHRFFTIYRSMQSVENREPQPLSLASLVSFFSFWLGKYEKKGSAELADPSGIFTKKDRLLLYRLLGT